MTMTYRGIAQGGVIVLADNATLPDGTEVHVAPVHGQSSTPSSTTIWNKLADLGRWAETQATDLPSDLAVNHDHYLHGLPKRS
jgi:hypothetical protein